jgi:hypothetical protein
MSAEGTSPPAYGIDGTSSANSAQQSFVDSKVRAVALFRSLFRADFHAQFTKLTVTLAPYLTSLDASAAVNSVQNHPVTQNVKDTVTNGGSSQVSFGLAIAHITAAGPVAESIKNQTEKTSNEFSGLANAARTPPPYTAANGQNLTRKKYNSSR